MSPQQDEHDLVRCASRGDAEAFGALVSNWEKRIYNYLLRFAPDPEEAFDLAQETFLKAYQNLHRLDDPARWAPWLYRIAHNEAISLLRKRRPDGEMPEQIADESLSLGMAPVETSLAVNKALRFLPADQRQAVWLKVCEGFKFEEIAVIVDAPVSTVKSRVYTALDTMRGVLGPAVSPGEADPEAPV